MRQHTATTRGLRVCHPDRVIVCDEYEMVCATDNELFAPRSCCFDTDQGRRRLQQEMPQQVSVSDRERKCLACT